MGRRGRLLLRQQIAQGYAEPRRRAHQLARVGMLRVSEDVGGLGGLDHTALLHHDDAVAIGRGETEVMRDQDRRHAAAAGQLDDEVYHRLLRGDVEAGGRLVRDQQLGIAGECQRDDHALAHAAGQLERIGVIALARTRDLDLLEGCDRLLGAIARGRLGVLLQHVLDLLADLADRIERRARVLEDHRDLAAAQVAHLGLGCRLDIDAGEHHRALGDAPGAIEDTHDGVGRHRLAGAGFADDRERLALGDGDVDMLHRLDDAAAGGEFDREIANIEQRLGGHVWLRITSCVAGRRCRADRRRAG
ncbi:hypothetical protein ACVILH_001961 [Bradyrhizobium sp. USDA 4353]